MPGTKLSILFVCLGNICRSPLAESVFRHLVRQRGLEDRFEIDSAGTSGYHVGDPPDARSVATASLRGIEVAGVSRQLVAEDLRRFDYVIAMDRENLEQTRRLQKRTNGSARIHLLREWDPEGTDSDVPDPYYGGPRGFDDVHDIVERSCEALLDDLHSELDRS
ncbi:MAG: low molecular weight phosphotyrosine protein phosphatase [Gemmatimonas sp.]|nr:low molecular weight phosphotyrosine protein phosphatase [Gemmatimonas sp.]